MNKVIGYVFYFFQLNIRKALTKSPAASRGKLTGILMTTSGLYHFSCFYLSGGVIVWIESHKCES